MLRGAEITHRRSTRPSREWRRARSSPCEPGDVALVSPTVGDIHKVRNAYDDRVSISIHAYGTNIGKQTRHVFDASVGRAQGLRLELLERRGMTTTPLAVGWGDDGVCRVTLMRPGAGNSLSADLVAALEAVVDEGAVRRPRLMVLRGEGRHFCTGFDLSRLDEESDDTLLARFCRIELMLQKVHRAPFPTLAIAHGRTVGAGADLFAACTHRLAAPGTQFAFPGASGFGLVLGTRRLVQRVGAERARRWVETGCGDRLRRGARVGARDRRARRPIGRRRHRALSGGGADPRRRQSLSRIGAGGRRSGS